METPDLNVWAQYGVLGIITGILILFARGAYQRERDRADRLEEDNKRLNELIADRVIPALLSAARAAEESADMLRTLQRERELHTIAEQQRRRPARGGD